MNSYGIESNGEKELLRVNPFEKIYRSSKYINPDNVSIFPMIVDIEITNECNLKCRMCNRQIMTRKTGYMDKRLFKKIIDECAKYRAAIRLIRWGEPFLHPHIIEFCEYVKSKGLKLHITNNGMVMTKCHMRALINYGVDSIIFSMQGINPDGKGFRAH